MNRANYFYRESISRKTSHNQSKKSYLHKLFYHKSSDSFMVAMFAFNPYLHFFVTCEKIFAYNPAKKCYKPLTIYLTTEKKQQQAFRKHFLFLCEVVAFKLWCYI